MKRFFFTGFLALSAFAPAFAQSGGYEDDMYSNGASSRQQTRSNDDRYQQDGSYSGSSGGYSNNNNGYSNNSNGYSGSNNGNYSTDSRSYYADDYDYIDYDDDYNYSTRFRRFNDPFYNVGYWSNFWGPWGYDPFWGPSWGGGCYGPGWGGGWGRPGFTVSIGYGGPYWSSYWGYNNWYGYNGFSSYWGNPYYGGWGGGYWNGYQNGYWNGYYAGLYGSGYGAAPYYDYRRTVNYGPRNTMSSYNGFRAAGSGGNGALRQPLSAPSYGPRDNMRRNDASTLPVLNEAGQPVRTDRSALSRSDNFTPAPRTNGVSDASRTPVTGTPQPSNGRQGRSGWFSDNNTTNNNGVTNAPTRTPDATDRPRRGWFSSGSDAATAPANRDRVNSNFDRGNNGTFDNNSGASTPVQRPRRGGWFSNDNAQNDRPVQQMEQQRGGWFDRGSNMPQRAPQQMDQQRSWGGSREAVGGGFERPQRTFERPQQMQQPQRTFEQPRMAAPAPRMEAPRMSFPSGGGGGGSFGGGGGGGFRRR